jgi:hypothetical protein
MAKQISPVNVWVNGETKVAEFLNANGINVTLGLSADFYWTLYTKVVDAEGVETQGEQVAQGNLKMDGEDYQQWNQDIFAWDWIASKLNLTII